MQRSRHLLPSSSRRRRRPARNPKAVRWAATALVAAALLAPTTASARKKGPLEGEPSVRNKIELRKLRLYVTPMVAMSLSQPFVHMGYVGGRVGFHFADWIGVRAGFGYGIVNLESRLLKDIVDEGGLPEGVDCDQAAPCRPTENPNELDNPAPLLHDFKAGLTRAQWQSSADVVFTPFAGKLGIFSALFTEYDIYIFGGVGLMGWQKQYSTKSTSELMGLATDPDDPDHCTHPEHGENQECLIHPVEADEGVHVGGSLGGGIHLFVTDWVSINLEVQDIITRNNLTGLNATVDDIPPRVDRADKNAFHNVTLQAGATFYIPFKAKRTR
jgi:outer membrane beta-barrel protein